MLGRTALGVARAVTALPAIVETPPNVLVIANRIDDITTMDRAQSFEFAGSDVIRNIYQKLVNFDPLDLDAGYGAGCRRKLDCLRRRTDDYLRDPRRSAL